MGETVIPQSRGRALALLAGSVVMASAGRDGPRGYRPPEDAPERRG